MTAYRKIFLDSAPVIYLLDKNERYYADMLRWMDACASGYAPFYAPGSTTF